LIYLLDANARPRPSLDAVALALLRFHTRTSQYATARQVREGVTSVRGHEFWPADLPATKIPARGLRAPQQLTDVYLAALAQAHKARLATFDKALAALHPTACALIP